MKFISSKISGVFEIISEPFSDNRGTFTKTFIKEIFIKHGITETFAEEYYSVSKENVLRGLHFQLPPSEHSKIVFATSGRAFDVLLDLRVGSPTYGKHEHFDLSPQKGNMLYIPVGLAHGFYALEENTTLVYKVSSEYSKISDTGILWNSVNINWPNKSPVLSDRDKSFATLSNFKSPFKFIK